MIHLQEEQELSEINVTPFIDIMLVLLIIFMVVAPLITSSIQIELPKTTQEKQDEQKPLIVSVNQEKIAINEKVIDLREIPEILDQQTKGNKENVLYFFVDKAVQYERLMQVLDIVKNQGYHKFALTQQIQNE